MFGVIISTISTALYGKNTQPNLQGLDEEIKNIMTDCKGVGLSVAIVKDDKMIYSQGFGFSDVEKKLPTSMISNRMLGLNEERPYAYTKEIYDIKKPEKVIKSINQKKKPTFDLSNYMGKYTHLSSFFCNCL
ncbi:hypothetical protein ACMGDK_18610 [Chryseobacterium sp. DT-3]|uniref:hypothetical protein n=1 Tax=Chryseobacterium sp. DT-3 TaxID=3396164 RepID=UPI003F1DBE07